MNLMNYFRAILRFPSFLIAVFTQTKAPIELAIERNRICWNCEEIDVGTAQCRKCWCFISLKVEYLEQKCPLEKW